MMGMVETQSKVASGVSSPLAEKGKVQGSEEEKKNEVMEALGTLTSEEVFGKVAENGVEFSSVGDKGLCVVESSVFETEVLVLKRNDCQVLADSEMNNEVSSLLKMEESGRSTGCEKLGCEGRVVEAAVLSGDGLVAVDREDRRDGKESEEEKKDEDCDGKIVTVEVPIMETRESMDVEVEDLEKKDEKCDGKIVTFEVPIVETSENMDVEVEDFEKKDVNRDGEIVTFEVPIAEISENMDVEVEDLEKKDENCDGKIVTVEVPIAEISENVNVEVGDLEKKDESCDGKIVSVEVPIAEISENMDVEVADLEKNDENCDGKIVTFEVPIETSVEMEDLSDERYGFSVGDFVWGKIKSHPWWPGRVYDPSDASEFALKLKQKNRLLVAYFGDGTFAWCHPSQLKPFEDNFDDMVRQSSSKAFTSAVQEAVNEVGRVLSMKMSRSFVAWETLSEFTPLLAKNSGIKEGVFVPENGIERLSAVPIEPAELLSQVKQFAEITEIASLLELEILKSQLSAFYLSKGGYKLANYEEPRRVVGLEDSRMDEANDVVEAPIQGPFEENYSTLPLSSKSGGPCHSPGSISNHGRKQKSIAQIMGDDKDVHTKIWEGDETDEVNDAIGFSGRKKIKGSKDKPVRKRKALLLSTDRNVLRTETESCRGKENSDKETPLRSSKKKEAFGNENISGGSKKETDEGKSKEQNERVYSPRERKKSKYLSPPFTTSIRGLMKENIKKEARYDGELSPVSKCNGEAFQEWDLSDSSNHQTRDDKKKTIDPETVQVSSGEVLSKVREAAVSPQILRDGASLDIFVDFIFVMRSSLYREGSLYKVDKKSQPGRKRKKPDSDDISPNEVSELTKRRKETNPSTAKGKRAPETKNDGKGTDEKPSGALLFVSFWPGSTLPSTSDIITIFSKFGALNEAETNMFRTNHTARVSFLRTCDAEKALNDSQNKNPFESAEVTYELQYVSAGSKSGGHFERSKSKLLQNKNKGKTPPTTPSVPPSQGTEASKLNIIKHKLQGLASMIESSNGKSPGFKTKLESKVKGLIEDVNKMAESTSP